MNTIRTLTDREIDFVAGGKGISHSFNGNTVQLLAQLNSVEVGGASKGGVVAISTVQVAKQKIVSF